MLTPDALFATSGLVFADFLPYPDISIPQGAVNFLAGESGAGKSSLLKMFNGTVAPTGGQIFYRGNPLDALPVQELRRRVLLMGQEVYLFPGTIAQNVQLFCKYRGAPVPTEAEFAHYANICRLTFPPETDCAQLSGGERQRLFLAIHLYFRPETILLDEPTSALDDETAAAIFESITKFCREEKIDAVIISHAAEMAKKFAENIIRLGCKGEK